MAGPAHSHGHRHAMSALAALLATPHGVNLLWEAGSRLANSCSHDSQSGLHLPTSSGHLSANLVLLCCPTAFPVSTFPPSALGCYPPGSPPASLTVSPPLGQHSHPLDARRDASVFSFSNHTLPGLLRVGRVQNHVQSVLRPRPMGPSPGDPDKGVWEAPESAFCRVLGRCFSQGSMDHGLGTRGQGDIIWPHRCTKRY